LAELGDAALIAVGDGQYLPARRTYDPQSEIVKSVLGEEVPVPDLRQYAGDVAHWLEFFQRLGMVRRPKAPDLIRRIGQLVQQAKTEGVTEPIRSRLNAIYTHIAEHWSDLKDAVVMTSQPVRFAGLLNVWRWLPVERSPRELEQWASKFIPEDRLYAPSEVHFAQSANLVSSQRPIFRGRQPDPTMRDALGFPKQVEPELLLSNLEAVIAFWHEGPTRLSPERFTSLLHAIYRELGNRFPLGNEDARSEEAEAVAARFAETACLWDGARFWLPEHAFQARVPFFGARRTQLRPRPQELAGYKLLGLRDEPEHDDFIAFFGELAEEFDGRPLPSDDLKDVLAAFRKFGDELRGSEFRDPALIVLTSDGNLRPADEVFLNDAPWAEARIAPGTVAFLHPDIPAPVREAAEVRSLDAALDERPVEEPQPVEDPLWLAKAAQWEERVRSPEFRSALERLIFHEGGAPRSHDLDWLMDVTITVAENIITDLFIEDGDESAAMDGSCGASDAYFDGAANTVFLSVEGGDDMKVWLAEKLAQELDDMPIKNRSPLEALLECEPFEMEGLLDRRRIRRPPVETASDDGDEVEAFDDDSAAEDEDATDTEEAEANVDGTEAAPEADTPRPATAPAAETQTERSPSTKLPRNTPSQSADRSGRREPGPRRPRSSPAPAARQDRVVTYVAAGIPKPQEDDDSDEERTPEERQFKIDLGKLAVRRVCDYERRHGRVPEEMPQTHPGYDVESHDPATAARRFIEVKAINGPWGPRGVPLSRRQFDAARAHGDNFWLYVVEHARDDESAVIHPIHNPAAFIGQYFFDGGWRALRTDEDAAPGAGFTKGSRMELVGSGPGIIEAVQERGTIRLIVIKLDSGSVVSRPFNPATMRLLG
jgi:hypothetical protein